ncbi:MAG: protein-methionine-sulfoxide reductase catalytic subunit MsrP [Acidobacteriota bacterium]
MLIRTSDDDFNAGLRYSDVTPKDVYLNRRKFLGTGAAALGSLALTGTEAQAAALNGVNKSGPLQNLLKDTASPKKTVTEYNNFYEFGSGKEDPAANAPSWKPNPNWTVKIEGDVKAPKTLTLADIEKLGMEERIYRHRCVERWSIVVPWIGVPLAAVLKQVEPTGNAKFVAFESYYNAKEMPYSRGTGIDYPYVEGLRLDEAMNPLSLLAVGMYGETMPNQNGAPIRLVTPWKYGFKSIKSIVKIRFTDKEPPTTWNIANAREYGFYSNVNPNRDHPRWSQKVEQRLGTGFLGQGTRIDTQLYNGYGTQVASLYNGMDLIRNY